MGPTPFRPEALADVQGTCELSLTRAIVQHGPSHALDDAAGRIDDIGLGLVLDGVYAASAEVLDLGSARVHHLDLGSDLVILDWVFEPTLDYVRLLLSTPATLALASGESVPGPLLQYAQAIALAVLRRAGFSALTRRTLLRIGFRDIVRDLDLHEATTVRISLEDDEVAAIELDYEHNALSVSRRRASPDPDFEQTLLNAFPTADLRRASGLPGSGHQLRLPLPHSLPELRRLMDQLRAGLLHLFARYDPERYRIIARTLDVFGPRDTLAQLDRRHAVSAVVPAAARALRRAG